MDLKELSRTLKKNMAHGIVNEKRAKTAFTKHIFTDYADRRIKGSS